MELERVQWEHSRGELVAEVEAQWEHKVGWVGARLGARARALARPWLCCRLLAVARWYRSLESHVLIKPPSQYLV